PLHELLKRQLRKLFASSEEIRPELEPLMRTISEAYRQADLDRDLLERALELTSEELLEANERLRSHALELEAQVAQRTNDLKETNRDLARQIRERRQAQEARHEVEQRYRALAEHSPTGIFHSDAQGRTLYVNDAWCRITGLSRNEAMGDGWRKAIHPSDRESKLAEWTQLVDAGHGLRGGEYRILRPDGEVVWAEGYAVELRDADGNVAGFVGSVHDITEHKLAQEIIRGSEERYRTLFEQSLDCIYISSPEGRFVDINQAGLDLIGFESKQEALKTDISGLYAHADDRQALLLELDAKGLVEARELQLRRQDGTPLTVVASITTVRDDKGRVHTMRGILRDVTETRQMERQIRQGQKMEAIGRLAGGVAHDFNNLLTAIIGYADLLAMTLPAGTTLSRNAEEIKAIARRGAGLTKQLLAFSRRQILTPKNLMINDIVDEMHSLLKRLIGEDIELTTDLDPAIRSVLADPTQIEQIVVNLAINARDAMPGGGKLDIRTDTIEIDARHASRYAGLEPRRHVRLTISDNGTGIEPQIQERIFEPFFTTKSDAHGTGLGLSTVYGAVQQSGGQIYVRSEMGEGSTFEVLFPEVGDEEQSVKTERRAARAGGGTETILIAEDEPTVRQFLASLLSSQGYSVLTACDGVEALEIAHGHEGRIDLLLSDVVMPKMNGIELAKTLRSEIAGLKVLLVTGYSENQSALREVGDAYLQKPFAPQVLAKRLRQLLDDRARVH
ncbi:MAG: PAS domain S-box protein, partial [Acidobacteriota bacterium]|nr:PAS domain S-box protein [Acidobacteriota bacterium]